MEHFMENDTFGLYTACVYYDWQQARDEGHDVAHPKEVCQAIQKRFYADDRQVTFNNYQFARALEEQLQTIPVLEHNKYVEPSDYEETLRERPDVHREAPATSDEDVKRCILGGWIGRVAGCLLGKLLEFWKCENFKNMLAETKNYPVTRYVPTQDFTPEMVKKYNIVTSTPLNNQPWIDELEDHAPVDDNTNHTVLNLKVMEVFGYDSDPGDVLYVWLDWLPVGVCCTVERVVYKNTVGGSSVPTTATFQNPFREWVGVQIGAEVFGWANPGNPEAVVEAAYRDACVSYTRNGIYGEMFVAAMVAATARTTDIREITQAGLGEAPQKSRMILAVQSVLEGHDGGMTYEDSLEKLHKLHNENNVFEWCHVVPNEEIIVLSLLYSGGDYSWAIGNCVQLALDTDSSAAIAGVVMGTSLGSEGVDEAWTNPTGGMPASSVLDGHMNSISQLVDRAMKIMKREIEPDQRLKRRHDYNESFDME